MGEYFIEQENIRMKQDGLEFFAFPYPTVQKTVKPHIHSAVELLFIIRGRFRMFCEETEHIVSAGEAILFPSNTIHRIYALEDDGLYYVLKLPSSFVLSFASSEQAATYLLSLALYHVGAKLQWNREECMANGITDCIRHLIRESEATAYASDIAIKIHAAKILLIVLREMEQGKWPRPLEEQNEVLTRRIYDTIVYINRHYSEELTMEDCSRMCFVSYSYFSRKFKQITGKTFKNYLLATRINHAQKALMATEKPITQIALECGFNNMAYFSAIYKKMKGISPSAEREQNGLK